jgi:soluble lytic murein transglycosylase
MKIRHSQKLGVVLIVATLVLSACSSSLSLTLSPPPTPTSAQTAVSTTAKPQETFTPTEGMPAAEPRLTDADRALEFGDYEEALKVYQAGDNASSAALRAASLYGQALTYLKMKDNFHAKPLLEQLVAAYPESLPAQRGYFLQAQVALQEDRPEVAIAAWQTYLKNRPGVLDAYVYEQLGDQYTALNDYAQALEAYRAAYLASTQGSSAALGIKLGNTYAALGQPDAAISIYRDFYGKTDNIYLEAQLDFLLGRALLASGETEQGYSYFQHAVNNYPETYDAYSALLALLDADQPVDDLQRGLINYFRGQYDLADEAFTRYLQSDGQEKDKALYYQALTARAKGVEMLGLASEERLAYNQQDGTPYDQKAITLWKELVETYPQSSYVVHAIEDIVYTQQAYMNNPELAASTALEYVSAQPLASYAPSVLFSAGRNYEIAGMLPEAAQLWDRVAQSYPSSDQSFQGAFFAGILHYRMNDLEAANSSMNRALLLAIEPLETASAYLWLGKISQKQGNSSQAKQYWQLAASADPHGYYGLRAHEILENRPVFTAPSAPNFAVDLQAARDVAAAWLRTSFNLSPQVDLDYSAELANDSRHSRGIEFWSLGMYPEARLEFESLRNDYRTDVINTFRLMKTFLDYGFYTSAIQASESILQLTGYSDPAVADKVPAYFYLIRYGAYYLPWVQAAADTYDVPILLLFSVIYQESRFQAYVRSSAGAQGLMQLMPATAAQIASEINYPPNFSEEDLAVPLYNLMLGTNYLSRQLYVFDGDIYAALAAYNSGPGNALAWKEIAGDDPDLFLGSVRYLESRDYIRSIAEIFAQYVRIYCK